MRHGGYPEGSVSRPSNSASELAIYAKMTLGSELDMLRSMPCRIGHSHNSNDAAEYTVISIAIENHRVN